VTDHDAAVVERLRAGRASEVVEADDPDGVTSALVDAGARRIPADEVDAWLGEARALRSLADDVLAAEEVLAGAEAAERARRAALVAAPDPVDDPASPDPAPEAADDEEGDGPAADRAAVRFSLVVLALAQVGGIAVYVEDGLLLAALAPALTIVGILAVYLASRAPVPAPQPMSDPDGGRSGRGNGTQGSRSRDQDEEAGAGGEVVDAGDVPPGPVIRAAEAHLRRRQAAWKVAWWERGLPPADVSSWVGPARGDEPPATLVVLDPAGDVPDEVVATMGAAVPAAVRVVVVRRRAAPERSR